jgi:hypothetical protein
VPCGRSKGSQFALLCFVLAVLAVLASLFKSKSRLEAEKRGATSFDRLPRKDATDLSPRSADLNH